MQTEGQDVVRRRAFGEVVRGRRLELGLSAEQFAEAAGIPLWGIETIENGERDAPPKQNADHDAWAGLAAGLMWDFPMLRDAIVTRAAGIERTEGSQ